MSTMFLGKAFQQRQANGGSTTSRRYEMHVYGASAFNQPLNDWRVDKVTNMEGMFRSASSFNQPLGTWRVDNVMDMRCMFCDAKSFNQPLGDWRVDKVTNMEHMFRFDQTSSFNQPNETLRDWRWSTNGVEYEL